MKLGDVLFVETILRTWISKKTKKLCWYSSGLQSKRIIYFSYQTHNLVEWSWNFKLLADNVLWQGCRMEHGWKLKLWWAVHSYLGFNVHFFFSSLANTTLTWRGLAYLRYVVPFYDITCFLFFFFRHVGIVQQKDCY